MKIFLDANVIFAAAYNDRGTPAHFIRAASAKGLELISSDYAWGEVERNLRKKAGVYFQRLEILKQAIKLVPNPEDFSSDIPLKAKDIPIYRAALYYDCEYLVTGDHRDFLQLMSQNFRSLTRILSPADCLKELKIKPERLEKI